MPSARPPPRIAVGAQTLCSAVTPYLGLRCALRGRPRAERAFGPGEGAGGRAVAAVAAERVFLGSTFAGALAPRAAQTCCWVVRRVAA